MRSGYLILQRLPITPVSYMLLCIIVGWRIQRMGLQIAQEKIMLIIELNIVGYRFSREVPNPLHISLRPARFRLDALHWRIPQLRQSQAA
jgi:hypothetical protein